MTKKALVTGITGQDGSYLAELLLEKGYEVHGVVRRSSSFNTERIDHLYVDPHDRNARLFLHYGDLNDASSLQTIVADVQPDEVYNLGAQSHVRVSFDIPEYTGEITALGTTRLLEAIRKLGVKCRFYQASSSELYGKVVETPQKETTPFHPRSPYAAAKAYSFYMTQNYREAYNLFATNGILFNHESERRSLHFVTRKVTMAAACIKHNVPNPPLNEIGEPLVRDGKLRIGNLDAVRDWGYAKEYVEAMWAMLQTDHPRDYVIATNTVYTVRDLCRVAFEQAGLNWEDHVIADERFMRPTEIAASRGDYSRARADLGWEPRTGFEALIRLMVDADLQRVVK